MYKPIFAGGSKLGCSVIPGAVYMYDFDANTQGEGTNFVKSVLLAAFVSGKEVSFHLYQCNNTKSHPVIGHVRIK